MSFFRKLERDDPANGTCCDCGAHRPLWASLSFGCYVCLECSGVHRSLGVHVSFVRSLNMDAWSGAQQTKMQRGGNGALLAFFRRCGMPDSFSTDGVLCIRDKYHTAAAAAYRDHLDKLARGEPSILTPVPWEVVQPVASAPQKQFGSSASSATARGDDESEGGEGPPPSWLLRIGAGLGLLAIAALPFVKTMMLQGPAKPDMPLDGDPFEM